MRGVGGVTLTMGSAHNFASALNRIAARMPKRESSGETAPLESVAPFDGDGTELVDLTEGEDPAAILAGMRDRVVTRAESVPNHTCVETVQRDRYQPQGAAAGRSCATVLAERKLRNHRMMLDTTDWLRLDVGMSADREMFSWPGATAFERDRLRSLVAGRGLCHRGFRQHAAFRAGEPRSAFHSRWSDRARRAAAGAILLPRAEGGEPLSGEV